MTIGEVINIIISTISIIITIPTLIITIINYLSSKKKTENINSNLDLYLFCTYERYLNNLDLNSIVNPYLSEISLTPKEEVLNCAEFYENRIVLMADSGNMQIKNFLKIKNKFHEFIEYFYDNYSDFNLKIDIRGIEVIQETNNTKFEETLKQIKEDIDKNNNHDELVKLIKTELSKLVKETSKNSI